MERKSMSEITITLSIEEIDDVLSNLDQCRSEGYFNGNDPAFSAMEKLQNAYFSWKEGDE
jgi:hypothetical protein